MKPFSLLFVSIVLFPILLLAQAKPTWVDSLDLKSIAPQTRAHHWLKMIDDGMSQPIGVPVIILRGRQPGPVLGLFAALHGNELNGIKVIQEVIDRVDLANFRGTIVAVPGLNAVSIPLHQRRYIDEEDLNRNFPGKARGNQSQQYVWQINQKLLTKIDYLVDMHTASFGRTNSLYVRAKMGDERIAAMARLQDADIILNSNGLPSTAEQLAATRTMRAEAMLKGIPTITVEYGNPQVYQPEMITRGVTGVENILSWLEMTDQKLVAVPEPVYCKKSYWTYITEGGYLDLKVSLTQHLRKGDLMAVLQNPFGAVIREYRCPEDGIVIGMSSNPVNRSGGRIIHLGIVEE